MAEPKRCFMCLVDLDAAEIRETAPACRDCAPEGKRRSPAKSPKLAEVRQHAMIDETSGVTEK